MNKPSETTNEVSELSASIGKTFFTPGNQLGQVGIVIFLVLIYTIRSVQHWEQPPSAHSTMSPNSAKSVDVLLAMTRGSTSSRRMRVVRSSAQSSAITSKALRYIWKRGNAIARQISTYRLEQLFCWTQVVYWVLSNGIAVGSRVYNLIHIGLLRKLSRIVH